jgi:ABC-type transporter MlaC component
MQYLKLQLILALFFSRNPAAKHSASKAAKSTVKQNRPRLENISYKFKVKKKDGKWKIADL